MRATFTTEFIYDGSENFNVRAKKMATTLETKWNVRNGGMIGQISGITRGLDLAEEDIRRWLLEMCYELEKITIMPFKIIWLLEGGDLICKEIKPNVQIVSKEKQ